MNTISIEILNPKAVRLLKDLADLNLIVIKHKSENGFARALKKMRSKAATAPTLEDITKEVEIVRPNVMKRIIIDTNLWISFLITKDYTKLDEILFTKKAVLVFSQE